ncbi:hypothetical protein [Halorussus pelagicus]|uniref:hypothetical protein n=1 Tax=Halorussus pelagicus TaxID=2505977 RepID=UPI000FFCAD88|nr:hypothetical protein [Halorussus pelagicus]
MRRLLVRGAVLLCAILVLLPIAVGGVGLPGDVSADATGTPPTSDVVGDATNASAGTVNKTTKIIDISNERTSIYLSSQRVAIDNGEQAHLEFSAVNYVTNERPMTVQLIFQAPSGVSVTGVNDIDEGDNQYVATRSLEPGGEFGTRITIDPESPGEFPVTAKAVYYFGTNRSDGEGKEVELDVTHRPPPKSSSEKVVSDIASTPSSLLGGFSESLPGEYAPLVPTIDESQQFVVFRFNIVYALLDSLFIGFFIFFLLEMGDDDNEGNFDLAALLSAILTPILMVGGLTRVTLLASIAILLVIVGLFLVMVVLSAFM